MVSNDPSGGYFGSPRPDPPPGSAPSAGPPPPPWTAPGSGTPPPGYPPPGYPPPGYPPPGGGWQHGGAGWGTPQAPKPGIIPLRPLSVGELLDGGFSLIRRYPAATLGLAAAVMFVVQAVQLVASYEVFRNLFDATNTATLAPDGTLNINGGAVARFLTLELLVLGITLLATVVLTGMLTAVVGSSVLGRRITPRQAWDQMRPLFWRLLGTAVLVFLAVAGAGVVGALPGIFLVIVAGGTGSGGLGALGVLALVAGGAIATVYMWISLTFATPVVVLEKQSIRASFGRSRALVRGSWWRVFGISLLVFIIASVISAAINFPFGLVANLSGPFAFSNSGPSIAFSALLLSSVGGLLASTIVRPFEAGVTALMYIDQRMRREALDLSLQQAAASPAP